MKKIIIIILIIWLMCWRVAGADYSRFYYWHCTWYVAKHKPVKWWWNAKDRLKNSKAKWYATWSNPSVWSIVVFHGKWYNPRYGHVALVQLVLQKKILISEMNYIGVGIISYRRVPREHPAITGFIFI